MRSRHPRRIHFRARFIGLLEGHGADLPPAREERGALFSETGRPGVPPGRARGKTAPAAFAVSQRPRIRRRSAAIYSAIVHSRADRLNSGRRPGRDSHVATCVVVRSRRAFLRNRCAGARLSRRLPGRKQLPQPYYRAPRRGDYGPQTNYRQDCYNYYGRRICCPKGWTVQNGRCLPYRGY